MTVPSLPFNDGHAIPQLGFGVYRVDPQETERLIRLAEDLFGGLKSGAIPAHRSSGGPSHHARSPPPHLAAWH